MGASATGTVSAAIESYLAGDPDDVLKEFHTDARIVGTKKNEKWDKKNKARKQLQADMDDFEATGPFTKSTVKASELKRLGDGVMLFHRAGDVTFKKRGKGGKKTFEARWTVVLKEYADGWKVRHSHFSLDEGKTWP